MTQGSNLSVADAASATGRSKSTILRAIRSGHVSAGRDDAGGFKIDAAELARAFPLVQQMTSDDVLRRINGASDASAVPHLEARLSDALAQVDDLKRRLDNSEAERRATAEKLTALLMTDRRIPDSPPDAPNGAPALDSPSPVPAPARRRWWSWARS